MHGVTMKFSALGNCRWFIRVNKAHLSPKCKVPCLAKCRLFLRVLHLHTDITRHKNLHNNHRSDHFQFARHKYRILVRHTIVFFVHTTKQCRIESVKNE